jgi:hypothetical protein
VYQPNGAKATKIKEAGERDFDALLDNQQASICQYVYSVISRNFLLLLIPLNILILSAATAFLLWISMENLEQYER